MGFANCRPAIAHLNTATRLSMTIRFGYHCQCGSALGQLNILYINFSYQKENINRLITQSFIEDS